MGPLLERGWGEEPRVLLPPSAIPLPGTAIDWNIPEARELGECPVQPIVPIGYMEQGRGGTGTWDPTVRIDAEPLLTLQRRGPE